MLAFRCRRGRTDADHKRRENEPVRDTLSHSTSQSFRLMSKTARWREASSRRRATKSTSRIADEIHGGNTTAKRPKHENLIRRFYRQRAQFFIRNGLMRPALALRVFSGQQQAGASRTSCGNF